MESVFDMDEFKFTVFLSKNGLGHFEQLHGFKKRYVARFSLLSQGTVRNILTVTYYLKER